MQTNNKRDEAWKGYLEADEIHVPEDALPFVKGYDAGFYDGAKDAERLKSLFREILTLRSRHAQDCHIIARNALKEMETK